RGMVDEAHDSVLLVFNPAEPHAGRMARSRRWRYRSLYLTGPAIAEVTAALGIEDVPYFTRNVFPDCDLIAAFHRLHCALDRGGDPLQEPELLVGGFGRLFRRHGSEGRRIEPGSPDRAHAATVVELMRDRHGESLTLDEMGGAVGLTPFQLIGLFKRTL